MAALKVERYFDQLIDGKRRLRPLPSALATLLRERLPYRVHDAGVNRAIEIAEARRRKADSRRRRTAPMQRGARRPADSRRAAGAAPGPRRRPAAAPAPAQPRRRRAAGAARRLRRPQADSASRRLARAALAPRGRRSPAAPAPRARGAGHAPRRAGPLAARTRTGADGRHAPPPTRRRPRRPAATPSLVVDRVVAVVGNRPVLASQVDEEIFSPPVAGQPSCPPTRAGSTALRQQVVASIVDEELLVQQAQRDTTIKVTDQEIADGVEQQVRKVRGNFTSEVDYRAELKKAGFQTPEEYRRWLTDQQRRAAFQNRLIEKLRSDGKLKPVPPTEQEMRAFFDEQKGQPRHPAGHALVPADRHHAASRRPRPRRAPGPRPIRSCSSCGGAPTSPPRRGGSRRTPAPRSRAARSTGSGAA